MGHGVGLDIQISSDYVSDYFAWPTQWTVTDDDLVTGHHLLTLFTPFIDTLIQNGRAVKTIKNLLYHLSILGFEIVRRLNDDDECHRALEPKALLLQYLDGEYGPLVHHWDSNDPIEEAYQKSFDATCRKLYKFIFATK